MDGDVSLLIEGMPLKGQNDGDADDNDNDVVEWLESSDWLSFQAATVRQTSSN